MPQEPTELEIFYEQFWSELLKHIKLDDVNQPLPRPLKRGNIFFSLPPKSMWITAFFSQKNKEIGVLLGWDRTVSIAQEIRNRLEADRDAIDRELGIPAEWTKDESCKLSIIARKAYGSLIDPANRQDQLDWFRDNINHFVNVLRPRVGALWEELSSSPR